MYRKAGDWCNTENWEQGCGSDFAKSILQFSILCLFIYKSIY